MDTNPPFYGRQGFLEYQHGGPGAIGWAVFALQLVLILGLAWLIASLVLGSRTRRQAAATPVPAGAAPVDDPLSVLRMRYARGEIGRDEYLQASGDLGGSGEPDT
jgi:uncharacterized membrane protein